MFHLSLIFYKYLSDVNKQSREHFPFRLLLHLSRLLMILFQITTLRILQEMNYQTDSLYLFFVSFIWELKRVVFRLDHFRYSFHLLRQNYTHPLLLHLSHLLHPAHYH